MSKNLNRKTGGGKVAANYSTRLWP